MIVMNRPRDADENPDEVELAAELAYFYIKGGALPQAGGLFDQDVKYVRLLKAGLYANDMKQERENKKHQPNQLRR